METNSDLYKDGLEFLDEPFEIKPENRLTVLRFNTEGKGPFTGAVWDAHAKAARALTGGGIYGLVDYELLINILLRLPHDGLTVGDVILMQLEVDKEHVLYVDSLEICFTQCNILNTLTLEEFVTKHFPQAKELVSRFRSVTSYSSMSQGDQKQLMDFFSQERMRIQAEMKWAVWQRKFYSTPELFYRIPWIKKLAVKTCNSLLHGIDHWERVERNAQILTEGVVVMDSVIRIFPYIHDISRVNDGHDPEHGARATEVIDCYRHSLFMWFTDSEIDLLKFACTHHSTLLRSGDPTIDACFDAERLDLTRRGIVLNPELMATEKGATFAADPELFKKAVERFNTSNNSNRANDLEHWGIFATQLASK